MTSANVEAHLDRQRAQAVEELCRFVRIPSVSSSPAHSKDVLACAHYLAARCERAGFERAEVIATPGHPVVFAEWTRRPGAPTVLVYGHHDVQPVDPLELWTTPPFDPRVRDGRLYGRGTVDDKGQVLCHVLAIEALLAETGTLPVNVKLIVEGEEEIGSEHLAAFLAAHEERLRADFVVVSDTAMLDRGRPSICYGLRGLAYFELEVEGSSTDLHSGSFGGGVKNPLHALAELVARLRDPATGRVLVPGFYDDVRPVSEEEKSRLRALPFDEAAWHRAIGAMPIPGEPGVSLLERIWCLPTLDLNGLSGGFQGEGAKTVIPARARAKLSCRLVPDQTPESVHAKLEKFVRVATPPGVRVTLRPLHGGLPWVADTTHPAFEAASRALERAFGAKTCFIREGGSIPFVRTIADATKRPCLLLGFGLPDENSHAPNEWIDLENYHRGTKACAFLYEELARLAVS